MTTNDRLKAIREKLGYNQTEMAEVLKISPQSYNRIERGKVGIPFWGELAIALLEYIPMRMLRVFVRVYRGRE